MTETSDSDGTRPAAAPPGWQRQSKGDTFSFHAGPFWFREGDAPGVAFMVEPHHLNGIGVVHGGALMTLADMALWDIIRRKIGMFMAVTVTLNAEFLGPGRLGDFIVATGEPSRIGKGLMFARGLITASEQPVMSFSGTLKRLYPKS